MFFYIVLCKNGSYMIQEDMESDGNKLESGELVCNDIHTYPVCPKPGFYVNTCKRHKYVVVLMSIVAITNIDMKFWTREHEFPQGNYLFSLMKYEITKQR